MDINEIVNELRKIQASRQLVNAATIHPDTKKRLNAELDAKAKKLEAEINKENAK
jgi:hypothetical protein